MKQKTHVPEDKKKIVKELVRLIIEYPIVGVVNMENLPAKQLQKMRGTLRDRVVLQMTKKRLMKIALEEAKDKKTGVERLIPYLSGMPAMLFTKDNPFGLAKVINANKSTAPIKPGQIAPNDITVKEGATPFSPGPVIGELGSVGIKAGIEAGKVKIIKDTLVVQKGEEVNKKVADILLRLGIEPVEIGLDLVVVYEHGEIITKEILFVDEKEYIGKLMNAHSMAFTLAIEVGYPSKDTIKFLLSKSHQNAKAVAIKAEIANDETIGDLLAKANSDAKAVGSKANV